MPSLHRLQAQPIPAMVGTFAGCADLPLISTPSDRTFDGHKLELYVNDELVSSSTNPALADAYFGIWLHDSPTSDRLREKLLAGVQVDRF